MRNLLRYRFLNKIIDINLPFFLLICFLGLFVTTHCYSQAQRVNSDVISEEPVLVDEVDVSAIPTSDLTGVGAPPPMGDPFLEVGDTTQQTNASSLITFIKELPGETVGAVAGDEFGGAITTIRDRDGNGIPELVVGAFNADDSDGGRPGAVFVIFLDHNGNVIHFKKITSDSGGFVGAIADGASFGHSVSNAGDLDGDGNDDILVGAPEDVNENNPRLPDGTLNRPGRFYVLFLDPRGMVIGQQKIGGKNDGFPETFVDGDELGHTVGIIPRKDGQTFYSVGVPGDDDGGTDTGSVYSLILRRNGKVQAFQKISTKVIGFQGTLRANDRFGDAGTLGIEDLNGDGITDIAVGASGSDLGLGANEGAFWVVNQFENGSVKGFTEVSRTTQDVIANETEPGDFFGHGIFRVGSLNTNAIVGVGAFGDGDGAQEAGALYLLLLNSGGNVEQKLKLSNFLLGFPVILNPFDWFGFAAANIKAFPNGTAIAIGAPGSVNVLDRPGKVFLLFLNGILP